MRGGRAVSMPGTRMTGRPSCAATLHTVSKKRCWQARAGVSQAIRWPDWAQECRVILLRRKVERERLEEEEDRMLQGDFALGCR